MIKIAKAYYGDQISKNMIETPEKYLICRDTRIGRIGKMDYLGSELPADFNEPYDKICSVSRTAEELFNEETMASFEFKPVTNTHPKKNLDITTVGQSENGQLSNIRRDGDYMIADLCIKDPLLIEHVKSGKMREVSCGYDCSWHNVGDGKYEQRDIVGNHVSIVSAGRAGPRVAIQDQKPNTKGSNSMKVTKSILTALGFKHFAQDAEPEEIAKAMDAMNEEEKKEAKDEDPKGTTVETKDAEPNENDAKIAGLESKLDSLISIVESLVQSDKEVHKEVNDAKSAMDALEDEMGEDKEDKKEEAKDEETETKEEQKKEDAEKKAPANDSAFKKMVQDMKPVIMAIADEGERTALAKAFTSSVRDARANTNGYAEIANTVTKVKKQAMDSNANKGMTVSEKAEKACNAWNEAGKNMKGGSY